MIKLCEEEILRYMGYPSDYKIDEKQLETVRRIKDEIVSSAKPKTIYKHFEIASADRGIEIKGSDVVLLGNAIRKHLVGAKTCIIMAATLGIEVDRILRRAQIKSVSEGLIADACATAYIEAVCDETEQEINEKFGSCNYRFSPGYADFPISQQKEIIALLDAEKKIGLCTTESNLLVPVKSVTAVLGVTNTFSSCNNKCDRCKKKERCAFSRNER